MTVTWDFECWSDDCTGFWGSCRAGGQGKKCFDEDDCKDGYTCQGLDCGSTGNMQDGRCLTLGWDGHLGTCEEPECSRPSWGCYVSHDVYANVDCNGDGIADHACSTTINDNMWVSISEYPCTNTWTTATISDCPAAFDCAETHDCKSECWYNEKCWHESDPLHSWCNQNCNCHDHDFACSPGRRAVADSDDAEMNTGRRAVADSDDAEMNTGRRAVAVSDNAEMNNGRSMLNRLERLENAQ